MARWEEREEDLEGWDRLGDLRGFEEDLGSWELMLRVVPAESCKGKGNGVWSAIIFSLE